MQSIWADLGRLLLVGSAFWGVVLPVYHLTGIISLWP